MFVGCHVKMIGQFVRKRELVLKISECPHLPNLGGQCLNRSPNRWGKFDQGQESCIGTVTNHGGNTLLVYKVRVEHETDWSVIKVPKDQGKLPLTKHLYLLDQGWWLHHKTDPEKPFVPSFIYIYRQTFLVHIRTYIFSSFLPEFFLICVCVCMCVCMSVLAFKYDY